MVILGILGTQMPCAQNTFNVAASYSVPFW